MTKHKQDEQAVWGRFEVELAKRTSELAQVHKDQLHFLTGRTKELETAAALAEQQKVNEVQHANRRVEDILRELGSLRERNHELETELSKVARVGRREELDFADEARTWAGICVSEKLSKNGDYILAYRDPSGKALEPRMLVDCKDKIAISEVDFAKLVRDAKERSIPVAILVARDENSASASGQREPLGSQRWRVAIKNYQTMVAPRS